MCFVWLAFVEVDLLGLYIPILINLLSENVELLKGKSLRASLHNHSLQKLIAIGPNHPQAFRQIVGQVAVFRTKLETAIRNQQNVKSAANLASNRSQAARSETPVIKLKTDFSNYAEGS